MLRRVMQGPTVGAGWGHRSEKPCCGDALKPGGRPRRGIHACRDPSLSVWWPTVNWGRNLLAASFLQSRLAVALHIMMRLAKALPCGGTVLQARARRQAPSRLWCLWGSGWDHLLVAALPCWGWAVFSKGPCCPTRASSAARLGGVAVELLSKPGELSRKVTSLGFSGSGGRAGMTVVSDGVEGRPERPRSRRAVRGPRDELPARSR